MKNLIYFCLGVFLTVSLIAVAQTQNVTLIKPSVPAEIESRYYQVNDDAQVAVMSRKMKDRLTQKWIVKSISTVPITSVDRYKVTRVETLCLVVYEKY